MIEWRRILLGLTVLMLLIPVVAVGSPEDVPGFLRFWMEDTEARLDDLEERVAELEAAATSSTVTTLESSHEPPNATSTTAATTSTSHHHQTTSTGSPSLSSTTTTHHHTTTTASDSTTTTGHSTTTHTTTHASGDTITGEACPCMVTGTTILVGTINLKGDILVDGGTLIARPGVIVNGNGHQIMFMNGGKADFQGTKVFTWSNNGANVNLNRDIEFRNMRRIMFHAGAGPSVLKYFTVRDSGTASVLGDYPLHWHLNGNSTRTTIVEGVVVINGKNHAYVPHGSNGITFKDIIAKNTVDNAFWWDSPGTNSCDTIRRECTTDNSNNVVVDHALVDGVTPEADHRGFRLAGFVLGAGSGNEISNSAAINVGGQKDCAAFQWPEAASQNVGGNVWTFTNNFGTSNCHGIFVWQNDGNRHVIDGFRGGGIDHGAYGNKYEYRNIDVPYVELHADGWTITSGSIDTVIAQRHRSGDGLAIIRISETQVGRLIINNATDSGDVKGEYHFTNTGMTCTDVEYRNVVPGTRVIIDGSEC